MVAGPFLLTGNNQRGEQGTLCSVEVDHKWPHLGDGRLDGHGVYPGHGGVSSLAGHCGEITWAEVRVGTALGTWLNRRGLCVLTRPLGPAVPSCTGRGQDQTFTATQSSPPSYEPGTPA